MKINFNPNATAVKDNDFVTIRMSLYQHDGETIVKSHITDGTTISLNTKKDKVFRLKKAPRMETIYEWNDFCRTNPIEGFVDEDISYGEYPEIISSYDGKFEYMKNLEEVDEHDFKFLEGEYDYRLVRHIFLYQSDFIIRVNRLINYDNHIHCKYLGHHLENELKDYPENEYVYILDTFNRKSKLFLGATVRRAYACPIDAYDDISTKNYRYFGTQILIWSPHSRFSNSISGLFTILDNGKCKCEYQTMERSSGDSTKYRFIGIFDSAVTDPGYKKPVFLRGTSITKRHKFNERAEISAYWDKYCRDNEDLISVSFIEDIRNWMDSFFQDCTRKFDKVKTEGVKALGDPNSVEISINGINLSTDSIINLSEISFIIRNYGRANVLSTLSISVGRDNMDRNVAGKIFAEKIGDNKEYDITDVNISKFNNGYDKEYRISNDNLVITKKDVVVINKEFYQDVHQTIDIFIKKCNKLIMELIRLISNGEVSDYITKKYLTDFEEIKSSYIGEIPELDTVVAKHYEDVM